MLSARVLKRIEELKNKKSSKEKGISKEEREESARLREKEDKKWFLDLERENTFFQKVFEIHRGFYDYSCSNYYGCSKKMVVVCPIHGNFAITPSRHLSGGGCPICFGGSAFSKTKFRNTCKMPNRIARLYVVQFYNDDDTEYFYKVGITSVSIAERVKPIPYNYVTLLDVESENSDFIFSMEAELHRLLKDNKQVPKIKFGGCTECFEANEETFEKIETYITKNDRFKIKIKTPKNDIV